MILLKHARHFMSMIAIVFLLGCSAHPVTPMAVTTPGPPPPTSLLQTEQPQTPPQLFTFVRTIQVTPDNQFLGGAFSRINFLPATGNFIVTFGGPLSKPPAGCGEKGFSYKEYGLDMQATGRSGTFSCDPFDAGSLLVDNTYYFAAMGKESDQEGWHLLKLDATNWQIQVDTFLPLVTSIETNNDPSLAFINGQIDISGQYNASGFPPADITAGAASHHHFFTPDLQLLDERILNDTPHIVGSSLIDVDGLYYFVTADGFLGDLVVMSYDHDWKYLGVKKLIEKAHWSTGLAFDGQRFYLAYMDTSQRINPDSLPVYLNVHLAAFDRDWNLLEDVAVTNFAISDNRQPGRPWVILHFNRLYVSYDIDTIDPVTKAENLEWQAYVSIYELPPNP